MAFNNDFDSIPTRQNSDVVDATWWNYLQIAGAALESLITGAGGFVPLTKVTIANNVSSATNVAGLVFDHTVVSSAVVSFEVRLHTSTQERIFVGKLTLIYSITSSNWEIIQSGDGDATQVTFTITSSGQVQYTSAIISGSGYSGTMKFQATTFGV